MCLTGFFSKDRVAKIVICLQDGFFHDQQV